MAAKKKVKTTKPKIKKLSVSERESAARSLGHYGGVASGKAKKEKKLIANKRKSAFGRK